MGTEQKRKIVSEILGKIQSSDSNRCRPNNSVCDQPVPASHVTALSTLEQAIIKLQDKITEMETKVADGNTIVTQAPSISGNDWRKLVNSIEDTLKKFDLRIEHMEDLRQDVKAQQTDRSKEVSALRKDLKKELTEFCDHMNETRRIDADLIVKSVLERHDNLRVDAHPSTTSSDNTTNSEGNLTDPVDSRSTKPVTVPINRSQSTTNQPPNIGNWIYNTHPSRSWEFSRETSGNSQPSSGHEQSRPAISQGRNSHVDTEGARSSTYLNNRFDTRRKNILVLRDSLLREFDGSKFSFLFKTDCENLSCLDNALTPISQRLIRARSSTDCIVIQLGINDLRSSSVYKRCHR